MITSNSPIDYILLDAGDSQKLESWNGIILARPDPMAIWPKNHPELWANADGIYNRSNKGGGSWKYNKKIPESWQIKYQDLIFKVAPTNFKHTGLFPEQAANWDLIYDKIKPNQNIKVLNLFAYTGAASMVASKAGAQEVVHLDASKGIIEWAKDNMKLNNLQNNTIRFIIDDAYKFLQREIRRGRKYDGIIMDPPSYGRGPNNELFKFEEQINPLIESCLQLLIDNPLFFIINTYTTGYSPTVMYNILNNHVSKYNLKGIIEADEIGIKMKDSDYYLPCGQTTRWYK